MSKRKKTRVEIVEERKAEIGFACCKCKPFLRWRLHALIRDGYLVSMVIDMCNFGRDQPHIWDIDDYCAFRHHERVCNQNQLTIEQAMAYKRIKWRK